MNVEVWWGYTIDYATWDCPVCGNHNEYTSDCTDEEVSQCQNCNFKIENLTNKMGECDSIEDNYFQEENE